MSSAVNEGKDGDAEKSRVNIGESQTLSFSVTRSQKVKMVEAGGIEPPSAMESQQHLRACPVI